MKKEVKNLNRLETKFFLSKEFLKTIRLKENRFFEIERYDFLHIVIFPEIYGIKNYRQNGFVLTANILDHEQQVVVKSQFSFKKDIQELDLNKLLGLVIHNIIHDKIAKYLEGKRYHAFYATCELASSSLDTSLLKKLKIG